MRGQVGPSNPECGRCSSWLSHGYAHTPGGDTSDTTITAIRRAPPMRRLPARGAFDLIYITSDHLIRSPRFILMQRPPPSVHRTHTQARSHLARYVSKTQAYLSTFLILRIWKWARLHSDGVRRLSAKSAIYPETTPAGDGFPPKNSCSPKQPLDRFERIAVST